MKSFTSVLALLAAAASTSLAVNVSYDTNYDNAGNSMSFSLPFHSTPHFAVKC
jgi:hypothetical protein